MFAVDAHRFNGRRMQCPIAINTYWLFWGKIVRHWLREARPKDGATPPHLLWRVQMHDLAAAEMYAGIRGLLNHTSIFTGDLQAFSVDCLQKGADYLAPDNEGNTVSDMIKPLALKPFEPKERAQWDDMLALLEHHQLNRDTAPTPPQVSTRRVRL